MFKPLNNGQEVLLCLISEIPELGAKGFKLESGENIFVIEAEGQLYGYLNNCPHANWPLNFQPDVFLSTDKTYVQCSNHMALFDKKTGDCISGPCTGNRLTPVNLLKQKGKLFISL